MKSILLIGLGRFGTHIAKELNILDQEVLAIDKDEKHVNAVLPYVTAAQIGDSTDPQFMSTLGINNFDACIVAIGSDFQSSLETSLMLKEMGAKKVVSRATREVQEKLLLRNGADEVVYPEKQLAHWVAVKCSSDHILDYMELDKENAMFEVEVPEKWVNKSVGELNVRKHFGVSVIAIKTNGKLNLSVNSETVFERDETLMVLGNTRNIQKCFKT